MIDASSSEGITWPDNPPIVVVARALSQASALGLCVYVYRVQSNWVMTTDVSEPPADVAVWIFAANQNEPGRQSRGGH